MKRIIAILLAGIFLLALIPTVSAANDLDVVRHTVTISNSEEGLQVVEEIEVNNTIESRMLRNKKNLRSEVAKILFK